MFESIAAEALEWLILAPAAVCFVGSFVGGTAVILILATLGGSGGVPWWPILAGAVLGNYLSDICWFALARSRLGNRLKSNPWLQARIESLSVLWGRFRKREWLMFVAVKFAYGLRIAKVLILGASNYGWGRFLKLDGLAEIVINAAAVGSGWMLGKGASVYLNLFENTGLLVTVVVGAFGVFNLVRWLLNRRLLSKMSSGTTNGPTNN